MRLATIAGTASFAHLLGRGKPVAGKRAEDEDDKKKDAKAATDEDDEKGDGDDEGDGPEDGKGRRADAPEREEEKEDREESDDEKRDDAKKAKKAKRAEGDDGDEDEEGDDGSDGADMRKKGARPARLRERARCAAIFADAAAGKNPALAAQLAFATDLPRSQAIAVLKAGGLAVAPRRNTLDERMAAVKVPPVGAGDAAPPGTAQSLAMQIVEAGKKRRGEI